MIAAQIEDLLRDLTPQVLGAVVRRYGNFDLAEDATQEALLAALVQWPRDGLPENPRGWLVTVASRRLIDLARSEQARRIREDAAASLARAERGASDAGDRPAGDTDDTLVLLFMCCHPSLSAASQIALTLRAVGGLSTTEIARALLASEQTVTRRITRAKQSIRDSGVPFALPPSPALAGRLDAVLRVLYLIFNEGYASTAGTALLRADLAEEGIRLARMLHAALPDESEVTGLLALMLLVHARHKARTAADGSLIPMADQDRSLWDRAAIAEGVGLITGVLPRGPTGPYQLQAAIAAVHDEAESAEATDWRQIAALYGVLLRLDDSPVVALNHAVAVSMVAGPRAELLLLERWQLSPGSTPTAASMRSAVTCSSWQATATLRFRPTWQRPGPPRISSSSVTSMSRSPASPVLAVLAVLAVLGCRGGPGGPGGPGSPGGPGLPWRSPVQ